MFLKIIESVVIIYFCIDSTTSLLLTFPKIESNYKNYEYLKLKHIQNICNNSSFICKSNDSNVCTMRQSGEKIIYRDFENSCFLFVDNMCRFYGSGEFGFQFQSRDGITQYPYCVMSDQTPTPYFVCHSTRPEKIK